MDNFDENLENGWIAYDDDWYEFILPAKKTVHMNVQCRSDLDIIIEYYNDCSSSVVDTFNEADYGGSEYGHFVNNSDYSKTVKVHIWGYIKVGTDLDSSGTSVYNVDTQITNWAGPGAEIDITKKHWYNGEYFDVEVYAWNFGNTEKIVDVYVVLEILGRFYFMPGGGEWVSGFTNISLYRLKEVLNGGLTFTLPSNFPTLGPVNFYAAVLEPATGEWSNIYASSVYFN